MKKLAILAFTIGWMVFSGFEKNHLLAPSGTDEGTDRCLEKHNSGWGEKHYRCTEFKDSYRVTLRNTCDDQLDVLVAVQESNKKWRDFFFRGVEPKDTVIGFACEGTGKYMFWTRPAGNTEIKFPTLQEINDEYGK